MSERDFTPLGGRAVFEGRIISVHVERFRFPDGEEVEREVVHHPGAAAAVVFDDTHVWLVRQPREAVDERDLLEIPAGRLDVEGEPPLETAKRELAEEIGMAAERWEHFITYYSSVGVMDEQVHVYFATDLRPAQAEAEHNERIEIVRWPLEELEAAIMSCRDAKTLIGLLELARRRG